MEIEEYARPVVMLLSDFLDQCTAFEDLSVHQFALPVDTGLCSGVFSRLRRLEMVIGEAHPLIDDNPSLMVNVKTILESMHYLEGLILCDTIPWTCRWTDYAVRIEATGSMDIRLSPTIRSVSLNAESCNGDIAWLACNLVTLHSANVRIERCSRNLMFTEDAARALAKQFTSRQFKARNVALLLCPGDRVFVDIHLKDCSDRSFWPSPEEVREQPDPAVRLIFSCDSEDEITSTILMQWLNLGLCVDDVVEISLCGSLDMMTIDDTATDECAALLRRTTHLKKLRIDWEICGALLMSHEHTGSLNAFPAVETLPIYIEPLSPLKLDIQEAHGRFFMLLEHTRGTRAHLRTLRLPDVLAHSQFACWTDELSNLCTVVFHHDL